jgi:hypothetical protein
MTFVVGLAMRAEREVIDRIVDGLKFHKPGRRVAASTAVQQIRGNGGAWEPRRECVITRPAVRSDGRIRRLTTAHNPNA